MRPLARIAAAAGTLAIVSALGVATPALAADKTATLSTAKPSFAWDGGPGNGLVYTSTVSKKVGCNPAVFSCETLLLKLSNAGNDLLLNIAGQGDNTKDIDLHLYFSDAKGTQGDLLYESTGETADEAIS